MKDIAYYSKLMNIELSDHQLSQYNTYMEMVLEKNTVMNLTAITDREEFHLKHFADSLSLIPAVRNAVPEKESDKPNDQIILSDTSFNKKVTMIDVGTGAGFPSLPLKIAFPHISLTLLDSLNKRINFLNDVVSELGLSDISTIHARAEEGARRKDLRDSFDFVVSRAVANLSALTEYCLPYAKTGGLFIAYKSGNIEEELKDSKRAISLLGGEIENVIETTLADSDISRSFVIIRKKKATPKAYPRKAGTAKKSPL